MDESSASKVIVVEGNILEQIRQRPAMYLGEVSLSGLYHFLSGYDLAFSQLKAKSPELIPRDFDDWVAYRLHFHESTAGYRNLLLERLPDEPKALAMFFELLDEYAVRKARVVASVRCHPREPDVFKYGPRGNEDLRRMKASEEVKIITYTNDPGFFISYEDKSAEYPVNKSFVPSLALIDSPYRPDSDFTTIFDAAEFDRLRQEDLKFRAEHESWFLK